MSGEDFGLIYASTFTGSLFGSPATVFAVLGYVIANGFGGRVDLNPRMLAPMFATTVGDIEAAIKLLCAPDPQSRTETDEGRRLRHLGGVAYEIVNHDVYRNARALEEKRAHDRARKRASRESARTVDVPILSASGCDLSQKAVTEADSLLSSSSALDLISPEGVQGEGDQAPPEPELHTRLGDWVIPPELYAEAERDYGLKRETLERRVRTLRNRRIPGRGVWDRTEYVREQLPRWATWDPAPTQPATTRGSPGLPPPWIERDDLAFARRIGVTLVELASDFARGSPVPPVVSVANARAAWLAYLERRASAGVSAAA